MDSRKIEKPYHYETELMWNHVDLYMEARHFGREFCFKWPMYVKFGDLMRLVGLRHLIDKIISKTGETRFSFGVKPKDTGVVPCYHVKASLYFETLYDSDNRFYDIE